MIIGLAGKSGAGKDTLASILQGSYPEMNFVSASFADKVKQIGSLILGVPVEQFENRIYKESWVDDLNISVREVLQAIGDGLRREINEDIWITALKKSLDPKLNYIITDVRYENEAKVIKQMGGEMVWIERYATFNTWAALSGLEPKKMDSLPIEKSEFITMLKESNADGIYNNVLKRLHHPTELGMDNYNGFDYILDNTTIQEFHLEAQQIMRGRAKAA